MRVICALVLIVMSLNVSRVYFPFAIANATLSFRAADGYAIIIKYVMARNGVMETVEGTSNDKIEQRC